MPSWDLGEAPEPPDFALLFSQVFRVAFEIFLRVPSFFLLNSSTDCLFSVGPLYQKTAPTKCRCLTASGYNTGDRDSTTRNLLLKAE